MRKVKWHLSVGLVGCSQEGEFEIEDDCSDEEIEEAVKDEVFQKLEWGWTAEPTTGPAD